jgi:hypothetical protein
MYNGFSALADIMFLGALSPRCRFVEEGMVPESWKSIILLVPNIDELDLRFDESKELRD